MCGVKVWERHRSSQRFLRTYAQNNFRALSSRAFLLPPHSINHFDNTIFISVEMSAHLTAVYTSPTATNTFSSPLQSSPTQASSSTQKSQYLGDLRQKVAHLQDDINHFLTKKMDQDKAATEGAASNDEDMEEQMYGEEVVDED